MSLRSLRPSEEPKYTHSDLLRFGKIVVKATVAELGLIKKEITHNAALGKYGRVRFERRVDAGEIVPIRVAGKRRWYDLLECEALEAEESRYLLKPVKNK